jgi:riboflavin biosynthesis pyrimidine reductase
MVRMPPIDCLFEQPELPSIGLPAPLAAAYGGDIGFSSPRVIANFVTSVDGVAALPIAAESGGVISGHDQADRFVMGLLRACASAVVIGAGTFRKTPDALWTAEAIYPDAAPAFAELRRKLGLPPLPLFVLVSASGAIDGDRPALRERALVATTRAGEARVRASGSTNARVMVFEGDGVSVTALVAALRAEGAGLILCEGGPSLAGQLVREGLLDELFLTSSPKLLGREPGDARKSLVQAALGEVPLALLSARRHGSHLFLRYGVEKGR